MGGEDGRERMGVKGWGVNEGRRWEREDDCEMRKGINTRVRMRKCM